MGATVDTFKSTHQAATRFIRTGWFIEADNRELMHLIV